MRGQEIVSVPWSLLNDEHARRVHGQSLEELAGRGGLSPGEILLNMTRQRPSFSTMPSDAAGRAVLRAVLPLIDTPPPLDVIRRGHSGIGRLSDAARTGTYSDAEIEAACADARAAMHPLPKEE